MDFTELVILIFSGYHTVKNMRDWYRRLPGIGPVRRDKTIKYVLGLLPVVSFFIIIYTLKVLASFDVVNDQFLYNILCPAVTCMAS